MLQFSLITTTINKNKLYESIKRKHRQLKVFN
jgi:hypothetical protein